jgi:hypothetical protein
MKHWMGCFLPAVVGIVVGCSPAASGNSCAITTNGMVSLCMDFGAGIPMSTVTSSCVSPGGSATAQVSSTACPTANRVGSCAVTNSAGTITYRYYAPYSTSDAMMSCQMSGTITGVTAVFTPN